MTKSKRERYYDENGDAIISYSIKEKDLLDNRKEVEENYYKLSKIKEEYEKYGRFVWVLYHLSKQLFDGKISGATLTRFIYLSTFARYSDVKRGNIYSGKEIKWVGLIHDNNIKIKTTHLPNILNLAKSSSTRLLKDLEKSEMAYVDKESCIYINSNYILKGELSCKQYENNNITRLYVDSIRDIYSRSTPNEHGALSYLFMMIPYVSKEYNILCKNPKENNLDKLDKLKLNEFCQMMGYKKNNVYRLTQKLLSITVGNECAISITLFSGDGTIIVNPKIFYAGSSWDTIKTLGNFIR